MPNCLPRPDPEMHKGRVFHTADGLGSNWFGWLPVAADRERPMYVAALIA